MRLSRKPVLTLVKAQHSTTDQVGTPLLWLARGDEAAYRLFFEARNGLLFGLLLRILENTQTAAEVLDEVFDEVRRRAPLFKNQNETPLTWLILIAHRCAIERLCRQLTSASQTFYKRRGKTQLTAVPVSINITEQRRLVRATLGAITPLQHRMIELALFSGMTSLEIAKELGQSPAAVEGGIRSAMLPLFRLFKSMSLQRSPGHKRKELGAAEAERRK